MNVLRLFGVLVFLLPLYAFAGEAELETLLRDFLAGVDERAVHERVWADDLVYTSSSGSRFGKQEILDGIDGSDTAEPAPAYTAEDVDIRVYDDMAVVAFRLVATAPDGDVQHYFNTGTFAYRDGRWQAVAWQATKIPPDAP